LRQRAQHAQLQKRRHPAEDPFQAMGIGVREKLAKCADLPSMPAVAIQILELCQRDEPDMGEISKLIGSDPALSAKLLRLTNSPMYGLKSQVRTVSHALCLLGLSAVRPLALSFSLVKGLQTRDKKALTWFWKRSLLSAVAARELAAATNYRLGEEAFLGALLQDIGILALRQLSGLDYLTLARPGIRHAALAEGERALFGEDHASLGAWLAERWRLPASLCTAIAGSHDPEHLPEGTHADIDHLVRLVAVSGEVADVWIEENAAEAMKALRQSSSRLLHIDDQKLEVAMQQVAKRSEEVTNYFDVDIGSPEDLAAILDQAKETLLILALSANRQIHDAREAMGSLEAKAKSLEHEAQRDGLTGLYNRAYFDQSIAQKVAQAASDRNPLSLILFDIDHFKNVNDTYGHQAGDKVLAGVAKVLGGRMRPTDITARYGGEEFVLLLPRTDGPGTAIVAERLRRRVAESVHDIGSGSVLRVTISAGHATLQPGSSATAEMLLASVDAALYAAKRGGRNMVVEGQDPGMPGRPIPMRSSG
jgi:diguanylate cyclase (GGDEF)-like protein